MRFRDDVLHWLGKDEAKALDSWICSCSGVWEFQMAALNFYCYLAYEPEHPSDTVETVLKFARHLLDPASPRDALESARTFVYRTSGRDADFLWKGEPVKGIDGSLSTVLGSTTLHQKLREAQFKPTRPIPFFDRKAAEKLISDVRREAKKLGTLLLLTNPLGVVWATRTDALCDFVGTGVDDPATATAARDALGLRHIIEDYLIEVRYSQDGSNPLRKPTVFHSGFYPVFIAVDKSVTLGMTLHLLSLDLGVPEGVRRGSAWPDFTDRPLGRTQKPYYDNDSHWDTLVTSHRSRINVALTGDKSQISDFDDYLKRIGIS